MLTMDQQIYFSLSIFDSSYCFHFFNPFSTFDILLRHDIRTDVWNRNRQVCHLTAPIMQEAVCNRSDCAPYCSSTQGGMKI